MVNFLAAVCASGYCAHSSCDEKWKWLVVVLAVQKLGRRYVGVERSECVRSNKTNDCGIRDTAEGTLVRARTQLRLGGCFVHIQYSNLLFGSSDFVVALGLLRL